VKWREQRKARLSEGKRLEKNRGVGWIIRKGEATKVEYGR
jgi:hypothetical protein